MLPRLGAIPSFVESMGFAKFCQVRILTGFWSANSSGGAFRAGFWMRTSLRSERCGPGVCVMMLPNTEELSLRNDKSLSPFMPDSPRKPVDAIAAQRYPEFEAQVDRIFKKKEYDAG
jgi:hypothetical protein